MLFVHENWDKQGVVDKLAEAASKRNLQDLTIGPVLTWPTERFMKHVEACLKIPGASLAFGGKPLIGHSIPEVYGAVQPTAVRIPIESLKDPAVFKVATTELFGPFQVIVDWKDGQLPLVLEGTISGTTYAGMRAKTTAAPQQHWFGPSGDPRAGGIHTPEAIKLCWSGHREIIYDFGPVAADWAGTQS